MSLFNKYSDAITTFVAVCQRLAQLQYVTSSGGNLAWKLENDLLLITPTKMYKGDILATDLVFVNLSGKVIEGRRKPTGELPMYLKFYQSRPDIQSVIHCHPHSVCAMSIMKGVNWLARPLFPEPTIEAGPVPIVPYAEPLTEKLAQNFEPFLPRYDSFMMENHGLVTMSRDDIKAALMNTELLESTARSILMALSSGEIQELPRQAVEDLSNVMKTRSLQLMGAPGVNPSLVSLYYHE